MKERCLIIAEAGVNHNRDITLALRLCDAAKQAGADVVKFQTWKTEAIITRSVPQAEYQSANTGVTQSQFDMLKELETPYEDFVKIKQHCDSIGITFASTADDEESLDFLIDLGIPFIKVGSGDIGNVHYLRYIGSKGLPVILSTGMSTLDDVAVSLEALKQGGISPDDITLLHCTTNYPCPYSEVNLRAMLTLQKEFGLKVGYSDHTVGIQAAAAAAALGACVIEKHFTLDRRLPGPDQAASTEPEEFSEMARTVRTVETCLGSGAKLPTVSEKRIRTVVAKRIVAKRNISPGEAFTEENICVKRNDKGEPAADWDKVIGLTAKQNYQPDDAIIIYDK